MIRTVMTLAICLLIQACSDEGVSVDDPQLSDTQKLCLFTATAMIDVARRAVNDPNSQPERRESRRLQVEDWEGRLAAGEDPCAVNEFIGTTSTTF